MNPKAWVEAIVELIWRTGLRFALWAGAFYVLYRVRSIIAIIIMAAVVTYAVLPLVDFLCRYQVPGLGRKIQRFASTLIIFVLLAGLVGLVTAEFAKPFGTELTELKTNSNYYVQQLGDLAKNAQNWYRDLPVDLQNFLQKQNFAGLANWVTTWSTKLGAATILTFWHLIELVLIPVLAFYFTLDPRSLKREFLAIVPKGRVREALAISHEINSIMRSYVLGQIILCVIAGIIVGIVLHVLHMPYVLILSVLAGVTRAVPVIGPIISGFAIVLLGTAQSPVLGLDLLIVFVTLHFVESKFIMPKLIGDRMQLHPAIIIVVLLIGWEFFGIFGMFMAAPVAALIRVLVRYYLIKPKELRVWGLTHPSHRTAAVGKETERDEDAPVGVST